MLGPSCGLGVKRGGSWVIVRGGVMEGIIRMVMRTSMVVRLVMVYRCWSSRMVMVYRCWSSRMVIVNRRWSRRMVLRPWMVFRLVMVYWSWSSPVVRSFVMMWSWSRVSVKVHLVRSLGCVGRHSGGYGGGDNMLMRRLGRLVLISLLGIPKLWSVPQRAGLEYMREDVIHEVVLRLMVAIVILVVVVRFVVLLVLTGQMTVSIAVTRMMLILHP